VKYRALILPLVAMLMSACGDSGRSPTAASTEAAPAAISASSDLSLISCAGTTCDGFTFSLTNAGPGCASATDLAGTVSIRPADGSIASTANWALTVDDKATRYFKSGETKTATRDTGVLTIPAGTNTYSITITKQTDMVCP
jgi:hypothetical protein